MTNIKVSMTNFQSDNLLARSKHQTDAPEPFRCGRAEAIRVPAPRLLRSACFFRFRARALGPRGAQAGNLLPKLTNLLAQILGVSLGRGCLRRAGRFVSERGGERLEHR